MLRTTPQATASGARRVAELVTHRRIECGYASARALSRASGVDYRAITRIERGDIHYYARNTLSRIEVALGWPPGFLERALVDPGDLPEADLIEVDLAFGDEVPCEVRSFAEAAAHAAAAAVIDLWRAKQA